MSIYIQSTINQISIFSLLLVGEVKRKYYIKIKMEPDLLPSFYEKLNFI